MYLIISKQKWLLSYLPIILFVIIAVHHFYWVHYSHLSPWLGGGYGMFSTTDYGPSRYTNVYALRDNNPTIFFEHRSLLDAASARRPYPGDEYIIPFGKANKIIAGDKLTVVTWGAMVERCMSAANALEESIEVIDLRTIQPWDKSMVLESVIKTGRCLIVHEDNLTAGFGSEIAAMLSKEAFFDLDAPIERLAMPDIPVPHNVSLMNAVLPNHQSITDAMLNCISI